MARRQRSSRMLPFRRQLAALVCALVGCASRPAAKSAPEPAPVATIASNGSGASTSVDGRSQGEEGDPPDAGSADDTGDSGAPSEDEPPVIRAGTPIRAALSKDQIKKVIGRHINEARVCYERELQQTPNLAGIVTVKLIIAADGHVSDAEISRTEMNNANVEQCLVSRVETWQFPAPQGGGIVVVNYPFSFTTGSSSP